MKINAYIVLPINLEKLTIFLGCAGVARSRFMIIILSRPFPLAGEGA